MWEFDETLGLSGPQSSSLMEYHRWAWLKGLNRPEFGIQRSIHGESLLCLMRVTGCVVSRHAWNLEEKKERDREKSYYYEL
ncbi:hypothetical protein AVEN_206539-1 [Araneus ventricosus]|uniref:Uncharacterized protein n=1 Tax=Araneus ventricosus TaxID=182803 RepID=A0A4Y2I609_ARAVE|nr:hypothetical protein AVEN_11977-1 [Araneus ventricosus]GBM72826.1 hypothetical protein AVEN_25721-1 [Araneus ventricosus]GBM72872.1 hypothetical protein AVEN_133574-1 [Araneus ventricosus]GBM72917.1 hypothetical protein AVEN_206539-1 [Araneus ventricosus]